MGRRHSGAARGDPVLSNYAGIDLSTRALDIVLLDEDSNRASWTRVELEGGDAWTRTLSIGALMPPPSFWEQTVIASIEAPYGRGQAGAQAALNRVVGAVAASLPSKLRVPERCWIVRPDEWKHGLGLKHNQKPTFLDIERLSHGTGPVLPDVDDQNARDAYCLAMFARDTNAAAVKATT